MCFIAIIIAYERPRVKNELATRINTDYTDGMMDDGALLVGRSKGLGGLMLLVVGVLWLLGNFGIWSGFTRWFVPLVVISLAAKMIFQSTLFVKPKK